MRYFTIEYIPDSDRVFRNAKRVWLCEDGSISPNVFKDFGSKDLNVSVFWEKYSTAEQSRLNMSEPSEYGVLSLKVGDVRKIERQDVLHNPSRNRAHSLIHGEKNSETLISLLRISNPEIPIPLKE